MKLLFVAPRYHTNQVQLIKKLLEKKHEITFHVACIGPTEDHSLIKPVQHKQSRLSVLIEKTFKNGGVNNKYYFPAPHSYWKMFRQLKPDIIIIRDPYKLFSLMTAFYALLTKTRIVFYTQEPLIRFRTWKTRLKQKMTIRFFKAAWMTPIVSYDLPEKTDQLKHMYYVPLPVNVTSEDKLFNHISENGPRIIMIGKYHQERKKHLLFIQALSKLACKYRFTATIVGECATDEQQANFNFLEQQAYKLKLGNQVEFKQNVPYRKMAELYASHHIFVLPAINEQYGVSVNEALGYGLPVICTDTCGAKFNISDGHNGFVVKSDSVDDLSAALEKMISDYQTLSQMRQESLQYARENLSADVFYSKFTNLARDRFSVLMNVAAYFVLF
jgi:glycosyltransferase involved in cell wall biosynthesis